MSVEETPNRPSSSLSGLEPAERRALLEQARQQARERALSVLVDDLTQVMLAELRGELASGPPGRPKRRPESPRVGERMAAAPREPDEQGFGLYVYGVIAADDADPLERVRGIDPAGATTTVREGQLAAIVSRVPLADFGEAPLRERLTDMQWLERTARTHEEVLDLFGRDRTLIPMRICSIYRGQSGIQEMLRREAAGLHEGLAHLRGRTEWGVKVFAERAAMNRDQGSDGEAVGEQDSAQGTAYLRRRREEHRLVERAGQELEEACQEIHSRLAMIAADALTTAVQRPEVTGHPGEMILNAAYLVPDEAYGEFVAQIDRLGERFPALELVLTGPWPAYNFVPGALGAAL